MLDLGIFGYMRDVGNMALRVGGKMVPNALAGVLGVWEYHAAIRGALRLYRLQTTSFMAVFCL